MSYLMRVRGRPEGSRAWRTQESGDLRKRASGVVKKFCSGNHGDLTITNSDGSSADTEARGEEKFKLSVLCAPVVKIYPLKGRHVHQRSAEGQTHSNHWRWHGNRPRYGRALSATWSGGFHLRTPRRGRAENSGRADGLDRRDH